jgi:hypothetical protein
MIGASSGIVKALGGGGARHRKRLCEFAPAAKIPGDS